MAVTTQEEDSCVLKEESLHRLSFIPKTPSQSQGILQGVRAPWPTNSEEGKHIVVTFLRLYDLMFNEQQGL